MDIVKNGSSVLVSVLLENCWCFVLRSIFDNAEGKFNDHWHVNLPSPKIMEVKRMNVVFNTIHHVFSLHLLYCPCRNIMHCIAVFNWYNFQICFLESNTKTYTFIVFGFLYSDCMKLYFCNSFIYNIQLLSILRDSPITNPYLPPFIGGTISGRILHGAFPWLRLQWRQPVPKGAADDYSQFQWPRAWDRQEKQRQ